MGIAVAVSPAGIVGVVGLYRRDLFESALEVSHCARLELDRGHFQRGPAAGNVHNAHANAALGHNALHLRCEIDHFGMTLGRDVKALLKHRH